MELSAQAQQFLDSLDQSTLQVGDGRDDRPIWVGIDPEGGKVYRVYASGLATGFGNGLMRVSSGVGAAVAGDSQQLTVDAHIMFTAGYGAARRSELIQMRNKAHI